MCIYEKNYKTFYLIKNLSSQDINWPNHTTHLMSITGKKYTTNQIKDLYSCKSDVFNSPMTRFTRTTMTSVVMLMLLKLLPNTVPSRIRDRLVYTGILESHDSSIRLEGREKDVTELSVTVRNITGRYLDDIVSCYFRCGQIRSGEVTESVMRRSGSIVWV